MPKPETRAWWDDVQYLRDSIERKRENEARHGLRLDARAAARAVAERAAGEAPAAEAGHDAPRRHTAEPDVAPRRTRRFERAGTERRGRFVRAGRDGRQDEPRARAVTADERRRHEAPAPRAEQPRPLEVPERRRTVEITGRTVGAPTLPRLVEINRRRPARRPVERVGARPDRLALWAVVLGFFLIFVAVTSTSHAATRAPMARAAGVSPPHHEVVRTHAAALRATPPAR